MPFCISFTKSPSAYAVNPGSSYKTRTPITYVPDTYHPPLPPRPPKPHRTFILTTPALLPHNPPHHFSPRTPVTTHPSTPSTQPSTPAAPPIPTPPASPTHPPSAPTQRTRCGRKGGREGGVPRAGSSAAACTNQRWGVVTRKGGWVCRDCRGGFRCVIGGIGMGGGAGVGMWRLARATGEDRGVVKDGAAVARKRYGAGRRVGNSGARRAGL